MTKNKKKLNKNNIVFLSILIFINLFLLSMFRFDKEINFEIVGVDKIYLAIGEVKELDYEIETEEILEEDLKLHYISKDNTFFDIKDNKIIGLNVGKNYLKVKCLDKEKVVEVVVTNLINLPKYAQDKDYLNCKTFIEEEAKVLDEILEYDINLAGYETRAGVVAAARFLSLKFPYKINYYFENGRLNSTRRKHIDGEGRYYHKGLYLTENKYETLEENASTREPKMWGCDLYANYTKSYSRNGLNCSGFISWVLLNGGFDIGDLGAGSTEELDFTDLGKKKDIDLNVIKNDIKVGDLVGIDGHIAIIIGIDEEKVYIAESYIPSLKVREFTYQELVDSYEFKYVMLMDSVYKKDGNLKNMWGN